MFQTPLLLPILLTLQQKIGCKTNFMRGKQVHTCGLTGQITVIMTASFLRLFSPVKQNFENREQFLNINKKIQCNIIEESQNVQGWNGPLKVNQFYFLAVIKLLRALSKLALNISRDRLLPTFILMNFSLIPSVNLSSFSFKRLSLSFLLPSSTERPQQGLL